MIISALPKFDNASVLVIGDVMLDRYWHGTTARISPEAPVPVINIKDRKDLPGGAGNVACNIKALNAKASLIGVIGDDEAGQQIETLLKKMDIKPALLRDKNIPTITKLRVVSQQQQLIRLDFEDATIATEQNLLPAFDRALPKADAIILSDYGKGTLHDPQRFIQAARTNGIPILVDPKGNDFERYRGATIITPNRKEFEAVVGKCRTEEELINKGEQLIIDLDLTALLVTRSEEGMTLLQRNSAPTTFPAKAHEVFDVTGAGDTVIATLATCLAAGLSLEESTQLSNIAASIVVTKLGAATVTIPELRRALFKMSNADVGVVNEDQLVFLRNDAKAHKEKVVMTNGCFDILHAGHIQYLKQARALGQKLIVAVNSDESVRSLKGPTRPINPLHRRMAVLAELACVDWVVAFSEETPQRLIEKILPDVLVKGGDYEVHQIAGADAVLKNGGDVKVLDYVDGCSTTAIIENIIEVT